MNKSEFLRTFVDILLINCFAFGFFLADKYLTSFYTWVATCCLSLLYVLLVPRIRQYIAYQKSKKLAQTKVLLGTSGIYEIHFRKNSSEEWHFEKSKCSLEDATKLAKTLSTAGQTIAVFENGVELNASQP